MAKNDAKNAKRVTIDVAHQPDTESMPTLLQRGRNTTYSIGTSLLRGLIKISRDKYQVRFSTANSVMKFDSADIASMTTYDSGVDSHYISKAD